MNFLTFLFAIAAGTANPVQAGANAELNKDLASPVWSALFVYVSGVAGVLLIQLFVRQAWPSQKFPDVPWWGWMGGLLSIASTVSGLALAHKLGSGIFTGLSLTASLATSVALDHFGLIGFKQHAASPMRLTGCGLMVVGMWLIAKF